MAEIDALHVELDQLETGDLGRLRHLAKVASEKTDGLAPQEVDLVELVLQTLFSLDQLFHLMRSRSRNLDLLTLRIQYVHYCIFRSSVTRVLDGMTNAQPSRRKRQL